jgi:3-oxoadipate enol-lactonase
MKDMKRQAGGVLTRRGSPIHYWLTGLEDAPLIALSHGAGMDHRMFNAQVKALIPHYRVLTWDMPGHGLSRPIGRDFSIANLVEDLLAILDKHRVEKATFIGQSLGGMVAQELVFKYPERVTALVIIGSSCITFKLSWPERLALRATLPAIRFWPRRHFLRTSARNAAIKPKTQAYALAALERIPLEDFLIIWQALSLGLHHEPDYQTTQPLLIAHGEHDNLGNIKKDAPKWHRRDPKSRYVVIPDAGHNANQDNPEFFNEVLLEFLREQVPPHIHEASGSKTSALKSRGARGVSA